MHKVAFILVPSYSSSSWLNDKLLEVTRTFINLTNQDNCNVYYVKNYEDIVRFKNKAEILVVATAGNIALDRDHLWNKINTFPDDIGLMGNILQDDMSKLPYLHEQFFIIKSSLLDDVDFDEGIINDHEVSRTDKSMHENYAPLEVFLKDNISEQYAKWGTKLILKTLKNNLRVRNFDDDWRYGGNTEYAKHNIPIRGYVYPNKSTDIFEKAHKAFTILPGLDDSQETYIKVVNEYRKYNSVNVWTWDPTISGHTKDTVATPATGFLAEITAHYASASRIIFYDINHSNLKFKKYLYENWDGVNYDKFAQDYCSKNNLKMEPQSPIDIKYAMELNKDIQTIVFDNWEKFKNIKKEYIHIDIIDDPTRLFDKLNEDSLLHTSNILKPNVYPFTTILYDRAQVNEVKHMIKYTNALHFES